MSRMKQILTIVSFTVFLAKIAIASSWKENAKAIDISGGEHHTLVLTANKCPWGCGDNYYYQLGIGTDQDQKSLVRVHGPNDVNFLEDINDVDAGWKHSLALESYDPCDPNYMGYVWSWGDNYWGELGDGSDSDRTTPVRVLRGAQAPADPLNPDPNLARIVDISAGRSGEHSLAVDANGYVYGWGRNYEGQLGNGKSGFTPAQTWEMELDPNQVLRGEQPFDSCRPSEYLNRIIAVSAGEWHSMALEACDPCDPNLDGRVYTWGDDRFVVSGEHGVLGHGADSNSTTPVLVLRGAQDYNDPAQVYLEDIVAISAGWDHSMALEKYDQPDPLAKHLDPDGNGGADPNHKGRVYTWGNNARGWVL